jgi:hypothetical protein
MKRGMLVLGGLLFACSSAPTTTSSTSPASSAAGSSATAPTSAGGTCVGTAKKAYDLTDSQSCINQGGVWYTSSWDCHDDGYSCDYFNTPDQKDQCGSRIGCAWQNPDGSLEVSPEASGSCSGTPTPCATITDKMLCRARCRLDSHDKCEDWGGSYDWRANASCAEIDDSLKRGDIAPSSAHAACEWRVGCVWSDGDGHLQR